MRSFIPELTQKNLMIFTGALVKNNVTISKSSENEKKKKHKRDEKKNLLHNLPQYDQ